MIRIQEKSAGKSKEKMVFNLLYFSNINYKHLICFMTLLALLLFPPFLNAQNTWADKLGFSGTKKVLLLHIDNEGIIITNWKDIMKRFDGVKNSGSIKRHN